MKNSEIKMDATKIKNTRYHIFLRLIPLYFEGESGVLQGPPESWQRTLLSYSFYLGLGAAILDRSLAVDLSKEATPWGTTDLILRGFAQIEETPHTATGGLWDHAVSYLYNFMSLTSPETIGKSADMELVKERAPIFGFTPALRIGLDKAKFAQALFVDANDEEKHCGSEELIARLTWMKDMMDQVMGEFQKTRK